MTVAKKTTKKVVSKKREFIYDDKTHAYTFDGRRMTGVTTFLKVWAKPAIAQWSANQTAEATWRNRHLIFDVGLKEVLNQARMEAVKRRDSGGDVGSLAHKYIEMHERGEKIPPGVMFPASELCKNYFAWREDNVEEVLFIEKPMFSLNIFGGGVPDRGFKMKNGKFLIGDNKFTSGIYDRSFFAQMAGYNMMFEEMKEMPDDISVRLIYEDREEKYKTVKEYLGSLADIKFNGSIIIRQGKPQEKQRDLLFPKQDKNWQNDFETCVSYDLKSDTEAFLYAVGLYRASNI